MPIIKLSEDLVRRIAAGEVVDRPSSVVKELIENGLDAGAKNIRISVDSGGKSKIVVEDDGKGISSEDLSVAVLPHTTSKIKKYEDLFEINSFGFRGEALASIGAVSKMKIETSITGETGSAIEVIGGNIGKVTTIAKSKGTRVSVLDLFFNVPARRKFLSSISVETRMVTEIIQKFILSEEVGFVYIHDDQEMYNVKSSTPLEERVKKVFGDYDLIAVDSTFGGVRIHGYISTPYVGRKNRVNEVIFVNGRYVRSGLLMKAIETGYAEHLKKGEFPMAIIFVDLPPQLVDVNVHPQKLEVKFSDQSKIFAMVMGSVKKALASPSVFQIPTENFSPKVSENIKQINGKFPSEKLVNKNINVNKNIQNFGGSVSQKKWNSSNSLAYNLDAEMEFSKNTQSMEKEKLSKAKILGVLHGRYIACEGKNALYLIDMHAAHERILYDKFKLMSFKTSQRLTIPMKLDLDEIQKEILKEHESELKEFGFEWNEDELVGVPQFKKAVDWKDIFLSTLESFRLSFAQDPRDEFLATIACKAAVKSGERISNDEIYQLINDLDRLKVWSCPHGRPLVYSIDFKRLDRYFGR